MPQWLLLLLVSTFAHHRLSDMPVCVYVMPVYVYVNKHMLVAFTQGLLVNARRLGFFSSFAFHESTCA